MDLRVFVFHQYPNLTFITLSSVFSFFALSPTPSSVPIILTLTTLLVYGRILFPAENASKNTGILTISMAMAGALSRLSPSLDALSTTGASVVILFLLSMVTSILTISVVYLDTRLCTRFTGAWSQLTFFPALWTTLWFSISFVSPVGRLSAWSSSEGGGFYGWLAPYLGPAGNDWVVAAWAVVFSQAIGTWLIGDKEEPLIAHTAPAAGQPRHLSHSSSLLLLFSMLHTLALPSLVFNNFPTPVIPPATTPLSVGCVLPAYQRYKHHNPTLDDYVEESKKLTSSAKVLLWPEGAVVFNTEAERVEGLAKVRKLVTGSVVGVSFEEAFKGDGRRSSSKRTGIAIVSQASPEPQLIYYKRHLVPIAESFSLSHSTVPPSIVTIELTHPKEVNKTEWASAPSYTRPIPLTSSICLDFTDPTLFGELDTKPALILAPARTWNIAVGNAMWQQARQRAEELGTMVLWCDGGDGGVSGVAGGGFRDFAQIGLGSWVKTIGIPYPFDNRRTMYARYGDLSILLVWILVLGSSAMHKLPIASYYKNVHGKFVRRQSVTPAEETHFAEQSGLPDPSPTPIHYPSTQSRIFYNPTTPIVHAQFSEEVQSHLSQESFRTSPIYVDRQRKSRPFSTRPSFAGSFFPPKTISRKSSSSGLSTHFRELSEPLSVQENTKTFTTSSARTQQTNYTDSSKPPVITSEHIRPNFQQSQEFYYPTFQEYPTAEMNYSGKRTDVVDVGGEVDYSNYQWFQDPPPRPPPAAPQPEYIPAPEVIQANDAFEYALSTAPNVLYARYKQYGQLGVLAWCSEFGELIDGLKELGFNGNMFTTTRSQALRTCQQLLKLPMDIEMQIIVMYLSSQVNRMRRFLDGETIWDDYPIPTFPQYPGEQPR
ncbi:hypothetical protein H0H81_007477 [Sphagnurus paluster]|uniref:CN hydrolase domain-containing protein n=1 Tax=Sphagnurus paluster TaxID=117069 RepID=A0A9P7KPR1_9AGAR|nr:hypothetical protein H0H81_007477 [Sphagnurus paluster]